MLHWMPTTSWSIFSHLRYPVKSRNYVYLTIFQKQVDFKD